MSITLPEGTPVQVFTGKELQDLEQEHHAMLDLQMPSLIRGDEDEDAEDLFCIQTSTPI